MAKYGLTWWGLQWLDSLTGIDYDNRLPRGRSYASNGRVQSTDFSGNKIEAKVRGSRKRPYKINIEIPLFTEKEKKLLTAQIIDDPYILSSLLSRQLPQQLHEIAVKNGIHIFPKSWKSFGMECSCPDWAVPCKHLAAVVYIMANEIDRNPFLIFQLHGYDILETLEKNDISVSTSSSETIPDIEYFFTEKTNGKTFQFDESVYKSLDLSILSPLHDKLAGMLNHSPLFYNGDFKKEYVAACKSISKQYKWGKTEQAEKHRISKGFENISELKFVINDKFDIEEISVNPEIRGVKKKDLVWLIGQLEKVEDKNISNYCPQIVALRSMYYLTINLLQNGAFIPQLLKTTDGGFKIRWIPAIIDEKVRYLVDKTAALTPEGILQFRTSKGKKTEILIQNAGDQAISILSIMLDHFISLWVNKNRNKYLVNYKILRLFFYGKEENFTSFEEKEIPNAIQLWIRKFYITHKDYVPLLKVEENRNFFYINVLVEKRNSYEEAVLLADFITNPAHSKHKFEVLKDLMLLSEHFKDLGSVISKSGKEVLKYDPAEFVTILLGILPSLKLFGINIMMPKSLKSLIRPQLSFQMKAKGSKKIGSYLDLKTMLGFEWQIALGNQLMSENDFRKAVENFTGIVKIKDQYILIEQEEINKLLKKLQSPPDLSATDLLKTALTEEYNGASVGLNKGVLKIIEQLTKGEKIKLPVELKAELRPYQRSGFEWMMKNANLGFGSLIADDMGLGKTVQVIAILLKLKVEGLLKKKKALVVVPTTLLSNWQKEAERFAPTLNVSIYHGVNRKADFSGTDVVITTYGMLRSDLALLQKMKWHCFVIDEAQNIKNPGTEQTKAVKKLKADIRIAMSGTPVENRLSEYWSILDFTNKGYLGSLNNFTENFSRPIQLYRDNHKLELFKKITEPFIIRRLKTDKTIINDLPDKIENNQYCSLTKEQAAIYQNVVENRMKEMETLDGINRRGMILKLMTALKQICNHPAQFLKKGDIKPEFSGKSMLLNSLLENILENNEKTLIFTQYKEMGKLLMQLIEKQFNVKPLFLHGGTSRAQRDEMVELFQNKPMHKIFILSLKAGGTGLNLTAASNVIHYDLWWNPAVENQATDRAYRIGQKKNVMVYRLLTQGTFEEKIDEMLKSKKELADLTVSTGEKWIGEMSNNELKELVSIDLG